MTSEEKEMIKTLKDVQEYLIRTNRAIDIETSMNLCERVQTIIDYIPFVEEEY